MNTDRIVSELRTLLQNEGIELYFGVSYDSRRISSNNIVHLLPFVIQAERKDFCYYDTVWNLRVMVRRELNDEYRNQSGLSTKIINEVANLASLVIRTINSSDIFLITKKTNTINFDYVPGDMNATTGTESAISFQIPIRTWLNH